MRILTNIFTGAMSQFVTLMVQNMPALVAQWLAHSTLVLDIDPIQIPWGIILFIQASCPI